MFATKVVGDEFGVSGIAFVAAKFLLSISFDARWVDEVKGFNFGVEECGGYVFSVRSGLFEAYGEVCEIGV